MNSLIPLMLALAATLPSRDVAKTDVPDPEMMFTLDIRAIEDALHKAAPALEDMVRLLPSKKEREDNHPKDPFDGIGEHFEDFTKVRAGNTSILLRYFGSWSCEPYATCPPDLKGKIEPQKIERVEMEILSRGDRVLLVYDFVDRTDPEKFDSEDIVIDVNRRMCKGRRINRRDCFMYNSPRYAVRHFDYGNGKSKTLGFQNYPDSMKDLSAEDTKRIMKAAQPFIKRARHYLGR